METRSGKCSSCGAEYRVPATFSHDVARCKVCQGVVHLSPARPATPPPAAAAPPPIPRPAAAAAPPPRLEEVKPRLQKGQGSTLERLRAQRRASTEAPAAAAQPEPGPAAAPRAGAAPGRPVARPAARAAARPAVRASASSEGEGEEEDEGPRGRKRAGSQRGASGSSGSSGGSRRGGRGARGARGGGEKRKKSMVPALAALAFLAVVGGALWFFKDDLLGDGEAKASEVAAQETPAAPAESDKTMEPAVVSDSMASDGPTDSAADAAGDGGGDGTAPEPDPFAAKAEAPEPVVDPDSVDLSEIEDFGPVDDTTDEEWKEMNDLAATWLNVNAGAAGGRAKKALLEKGRKAFPVILNHMKLLDFSTEEGKLNGDQCQRALQELCNGINFEWKYGTEPEDVLFNKKVVVAWATQWRRAATSIEYWINMTKLESKDPEEARRLRAQFGSQDAGKGKSDDDLDVD